MAIVQTLILLSVLVIIHELGHFLAARLFGVRVLEFAVGFGPVVAKTVRHGTQYALRAIPMGGFVKLAGMEMAVEGETEPVEADDPASMANQPAWKKALIVMAGPVNNLILAALTITVMLAVVGVPRATEKRSIIGFVDPKTPGYEAGLSTGDRVVACNGQPIALWEELAKAIRGSKGRPVTLLINREGRTFSRTITPFYDPMFKAYRLGIAAKQFYQRLPLGQSVLIGVTSIYWGSVNIVQMIVAGLTGRARVPLAGPVGMVGMVGESVKAGAASVFNLIASLNLFLGLFNLLPIPLPLLDGGWVVIYLLERLRRREFTAEQKAAAQLLGLLILGSFFLFVTYSDLVTGIRRFMNR